MSVEGVVSTDFEASLDRQIGLNRLIHEVLVRTTPRIPEWCRIPVGCVVAYIVDRSHQTTEPIPTPYGEKVGFHAVGLGAGGYAVLHDSKHSIDRQHFHSVFEDATMKDNTFQSMKSSLKWTLTVVDGVTPANLVATGKIILDPRVDADRLRVLAKLPSRGVAGPSGLMKLFTRGNK